MVVHSYDGLDEITTADKTMTWVVEDGTITPRELSPDDFGLPYHPLTDILGSTPPDNARTFLRLLRGEAATDPKLVPVLDFVLLNASAALYVARVAKDFKEGVAIARDAINDGRALRLVEEYIAVSNQYRP